MFEAVGAEYFETFFQACDRALKPGGRMAMQTISLPDRAFVPVRDGVNWVQKYIFPGGMLPSIAEIERSLRSDGSRDRRAGGHRRALRADAAPLARALHVAAAGGARAGLR